MMRFCPPRTCPVRYRYPDSRTGVSVNGRPEFVTTFFEYIAEEVREHLAALGLAAASKKPSGRADLLDAAPAIEHWKAGGIDLTTILTVPDSLYNTARHCTRQQDHGLAAALDHEFLEVCRPSIEARRRSPWIW